MPLKSGYEVDGYFHVLAEDYWAAKKDRLERTWPRAAPEFLEDSFECRLKPRVCLRVLQDLGIRLP